MGYTGKSKQIIETIIKVYDPKSVMDLGSQQDYDQPNLPAPYIDAFYKDKGIDYKCIDLNQENNAYGLDLSEPLPEDFLNFEMDKENGEKFQYSRVVDLVVDAGTSEHVCKDGAFSWEAIYNCWLNKHKLLKVGGIMVNENPKTGNWPGHGFNYYTKEFYRQLEAASDYAIILLDEHPAMENRIDGWNIICVLQKKGVKFPTLEEFQHFDLRQS